MKVLAISYGRNLFQADNPERARMRECAGVVAELHIIVFARNREGFTKVQDGNLTIYPTGGLTKVGMLIRGFLLGRKILKNARSTTDFVITTQDPFEAGLVGYFLACLYKIKLNLQEHGDFFSTNHWKKETIFNRWRFALGKFLLKRADTVRVVSVRMLTTMTKIGVAKDKLRILSVSVPLEKFLATREIDFARKLFPPESVIILTVARIVAQKNLELLIKSFAVVGQTQPQARLLIIGTGVESKAIKQLADNLGLLKLADPKVIFLPWTDDVSGYMHSSDIYALSSNYEGYARVIPEAMASGLPIVATDVGCVGEIFKHQLHGLTVPVGDKVAFTSALNTLVKDAPLRLRFGTMGNRALAEANTMSTSYADSWFATLT